MSEIERYKALLRLVKQMRDKQKEYFKLRQSPYKSDVLRALEESKAIEKKVDWWLHILNLDSPDRQTSLF